MDTKIASLMLFLAVFSSCSVLENILRIVYSSNIFLYYGGKRFSDSTLVSKESY